jgi:predicted small lipoprotein YifL
MLGTPRLRRLTYVKPAMRARCASENRRMKTLMILIALLSLAACNREGPAEKAGRNIDNAASKAAKGVENAGDKVRDAVNGKK